uniref:Thiamine transporter 2-like n=1 Tax=Mastacembelus armatus TaxID=205130 RepID=A0A3Q3S8X6_9TELE
MYLLSQPHIFSCLTIARKTSEEKNNNGKAGDLVFIVGLTLALSEVSISQRIKLPKLDCALAGHSETSPGSRRGTMGFCCSGECGNRPCWAGHYMPCYAGWVGPTVLLCIYGFSSMMRPIEPFMAEFFTGSYKNLTTEQVTKQVLPVWTYSSLILLIPVLLVTDLLRYKPVIILQGLTYVTTFLLILFGSGVGSAQLALFSYSIAMAADVAYISYIYSVVQPSYYQRVTSYVRGANLLGYAVGALLAQMLVSLGGVSLYCLAFITLISVSGALITSLFLPMPKSSLFFKGTHLAQERTSDEDADDSESQDFNIWVKSVRAAKHVERMFRRLILDCKECYSSVAVLFFCIWSATGTCGFYQIEGYVQLLWVYIQPHNFTAYNGGVAAISTLSGKLGHHQCYICYILCKTIYMQLITICTFQIAKTLSRTRYALVFGMNSFFGTVLQSVLTAIVINTKSLQLTIIEQFFIYASYFAAISLLFIVRGVYTVLHMKRSGAGNQAERATDLPEGSHL